MVAAPDVSDGEVEPVVDPVVELVPELAPASVGVFTWPAGAPETPEVAPLDVDGVAVEAEGGAADVSAPVELLAPIEPLVVALGAVELAALAPVPVVAAMFAPDHQSREARSFGEAAR